MTVSMLVPVDITLFGWPQVQTTSPLAELGLLVGVPLVVIVIVFAVAKGHAVLRASKLGPGPQASDPVWMGGRSRSIMGGAEDELPEAEGPRGELEAAPAGATARETGGAEAREPATTEAGTGGASARW